MSDPGGPSRGPLGASTAARQRMNKACSALDPDKVNELELPVYAHTLRRDRMYYLTERTMNVCWSRGTQLTDYARA